MSAHDEKTRLRGRPFAIGIVVFVVLMTVIFFVIAGLLRQWSREPWPDHGPPSGPEADARWNITAPQEQVQPEIDLETLRAAEDRRLHARVWTDSSHAYVTIPIEDAMQLLADAATKGQLTSVLPAPQPATPIDLQRQKAGEAAPPQIPNP